MGARALRVVGATKHYGAPGQGPAVLADVSLEVSDGETVILLGPSGCGKSTLLRAIAGLEPLTAGHVDIDHGQAETHSVGLVFQDPLLLPWLTVAENVTLGLRYSPMGVIGLWMVRRKEVEWASAKPKRFAYLGKSVNVGAPCTIGYDPRNRPVRWPLPGANGITTGTPGSGKTAYLIG